MLLFLLFTDEESEAQKVSSGMGTENFALPQAATPCAGAHSARPRGTPHSAQKGEDHVEDLRPELHCCLSAQHLEKELQVALTQRKTWSTPLKLNDNKVTHN